MIGFYLINLILNGFEKLENPDVRKFRLAKSNSLEMIKSSTPENLFENYHSAEKLVDVAFRDFEMAGYEFEFGANVASAIFKCELSDRFVGNNSYRDRKKFQEAMILNIDRQIKILEEDMGYLK
ncbi:MAG: hypothetical protein WC584_01250 [Candidatus Pacearchaeota archaeon]